MTAPTETAVDRAGEHPHQLEEGPEGGEEVETDEIEVLWAAKSTVDRSGEHSLQRQPPLPATTPVIPTHSIAADVPDGHVPIVGGGEGPSHQQHGRPERRRAPLRQLGCPCCLRLNTFGSAHQLEMHLARAHFPCRPYPCTACGGLDRFSTEQELWEHYRLGHSLMKGEFQVGPFCYLPFPSISIMNSPLPTQIAYLPVDEREAFAYSQVKRVLKMVLDEAGQGGSG